MQIDQYSPCPCGSGKKLKFCKCVDQPQEYEKLTRLIDGGQELAAMDRINHMLSKTPNAAWLLAIKANLSIMLDEIDTFKDTANRFLKLKPDNPQALIMKSVAAGIDSEPVEQVAKYLLDGLSETRHSLPDTTLMAIEVLLSLLERDNQLSLSGYWAEVQHMLSSKAGKDAHRMVLQLPHLNLLAKSTSRAIDDPPGSAWNERLAEVLSLTRTFRFAQAETKLRSILRDFPDQPGPLSHLLRTQVVQLNQTGAYTTAMKLAEHPQVTAEDRVFFRAFAFEIEPQKKSLWTEPKARYGEVESIEPIIESLSNRLDTEDVQGELGERLKLFISSQIGEDVLARKIYWVFDSELKAKEQQNPESASEGSDETSAAPAGVASALATVVLYAKQTDSPARALLLATTFPDYSQRIEELVALLNFTQEMEIPEFARAQAYTEFLTRNKWSIGQQVPPSIQAVGEVLKRDFLNLPMKLFGGASPLEAAKDERHRSNLLGLLSHLEGQQDLVVPQSAINEIYQVLDLQRPTGTLLDVSEGALVENVLDLDRLNFAELEDTHLMGVLFRAGQMGANRILYHSSVEVRKRPSFAEHVATQKMALMTLRHFADSRAQNISYGRELLDLHIESGETPGSLLYELISMLGDAGRLDEAREVFFEVANHFPDDPYVLSFMEHVLRTQQSSAGHMPDGQAADPLAQRLRMHSAGSGTEQEGSGLVLPGQSDGAPQSESKLWLPGS